jgi:stearoyl-CoA desaturase (delta-9 desaturase)
MYEYDGISEKRFDNVMKQSVFWGVHATCLLVFVVGFSWIALAVCVGLYVARMFAITGGFHRYFSHRSYKTSRVFQFLLGFLGTSSAQKGPIWWASHHRHHHQYSDTPEDIHPPAVYGLYWAHVGWVLSSQYLKPRLELVRDLLKFPEIQWLDKWHLVPPTVLGVGVYAFGALCERYAPGLGTNGFQMLVWGFFLSTTLLYHGTFFINSLAHIVGNRRFETTDHSRNNFWLALITLGEGWHNNHHRYPGSERQGFYWWEIDITHYILKMLSWVGLVWELRTPPERIYQEAEQIPA